MAPPAQKIKPPKNKLAEIEPAKIEPPRLGEPYLLTPGPLSTSYETKAAMLADRGSWDIEFRRLSAELRTLVLEMTGDTSGELDCVPMQGSGSFSVEAMLGSFIAPDDKALVLSNGAYGQRIALTLEYLGRAHTVIDKGDYLPPRAEEVSEAIRTDPAITHVVVVHCETSSGILNPVREISGAVHKAGRKLLIDSMSAFGAIDVNINEIRYQALVSSANKCIEGVPGFGFIIAPKTELEAARGHSHSLCLDVHAQWEHMRRTGQWRFTPPTHAVAAFVAALKAHKREGGVAARLDRYTKNRDVLVAGMRALGFETLLAERWMSPIIVSFFCPRHQAFVFELFYELMKKQGFIIYPGKLTIADSFRIGCIGQIDQHVMTKVVNAAGRALEEMGVGNAAPPRAALRQQARTAA